ncbi:hypothetical protein Cni_G28143 [Canna indica]|uniref:Uncharacterized protein n=1 Tax=Canna indica TaxID=4628 RepID=A0AAQ3L2V4_9LILI|nr:hypothetical protein Cni_G28143 [Canna indica]
MEAAEALVAAGEQRSSGGSRWTASTNWIVSGGSLRDVISFDTSEEDAPAPAISTSLLLLRPPEVEEDEFLPCEVTFLLNGKHEIHRIYVCSTARVYEIYYATKKQSDCTEYLCTVRCGVADKEVTPVISSVVSADSESGNNATLEKQDKISIADSNCSNEDGWVEVVANSPLHDYKTNAISREVDRNPNTEFQVYYEATAEISDFSPCMSVTLRFLSLQTKTCIHISEIYIFADPVETLTPDTSVTMEENFGGGSLLAMFMPSLLHLSKSAANSGQNKRLFDTSESHKHQDDEQKAAEIASSGTKISLPGERSFDKTDHLLGLGHEQSQLKPEYSSSAWKQRVSDQTADSCSENQELDQVHDQSRIKPDGVQFGSSPKITEEEASSSNTMCEAKEKLENAQLMHSKKQSNPELVPEFSAQEKCLAGNHIERVLDELVSRVTRIETFCSRFEERLLKPLSSIETRLQKLETLLDTFASCDQLRQQGGGSRISAPDFSADGSDSQSKDIMNSSSTSGNDTVHDSSLPDDATECSSVAAGGVTASIPESRVYEGFVMKAPEFISEDDECSKNDDGLASDEKYSENKNLLCIDKENDECIRDNARLASSLNSIEGKKSSIDSALASALEAFMISNSRLHVMEPYQLSTVGDESSMYPSVAGVIYNGTDKSVNYEVKEEIPVIESSLEAFITSNSRLHVMEPYQLSTAGDESSIYPSFAGVISNGTDKSVNYEVKEEFSVIESSLSVAEASKMSVRNSDKDNGCDVSGILEVSSALNDSSILFGTWVSSMPSSLMDSGLRFGTSDSPKDEDEFGNYGDTEDSSTNNSHKDQACLHLNDETVSKMKHYSSMEVLVEKSSDFPPEICPEKREDETKSHQSSTCAVATEERLITKDLSCSVSLVLDKERQVGIVLDGDENRVELDGPELNQLGEEWNRNSLADQYSGQTGIENRSTHVAMMSTTSQDNSTFSTNYSTSLLDNIVGHKPEKTPNSATCSDDLILEVEFAPERDWTTGVSLETLLGETYDTGVQNSVIGEVTENRNAGEQLLEGMQNLVVLADISGLSDDVGGSCLNVNMDDSGAQNFYYLL